jgi:hypothetical protein
MGAAIAIGPINTITFEDQPVGYNATLIAAPGVTVTLSGDQFFPGWGTGVHNITLGNLFGFNTTPGGSNWLGFYGFPVATCVFTFADPTNSFGMYMTGLQTPATMSLTIKFTDNASEVLSLPVNSGGGAQYYGFTDSIPFSSISITNIDPDVNESDIWGIDDVTYNVTSSAVPEPCTILLFGTGLGGFVVYRLRSKKA